MYSENVQTAALAAKQHKIPSALFWQAVTLLFAFILLAITAWMDYSPLLETPPDVLRSRDIFLSAKEIFRKKPQYWSVKRQQIEEKIAFELEEQNGESLSCLIHEISPEILLSFVNDTLEKPMQSWGSFAISSHISGSTLLVLLSKYEKATWPLPIILSLELEVHFTTKGIEVAFHRLRRGSQDLSHTDTRSYFGSELDLLKTKTKALIRPPLGGT